MIYAMVDAQIPDRRQKLVVEAFERAGAAEGSPPQP